MRSGFGGKTASSISSTSMGKQTVADRAGGKHSIVRAIGGADILTWIDATNISDAMAADITSVKTLQGYQPTVGNTAPKAEYNTVLRSTAYDFATNDGAYLRFNGAGNLFPSGLKAATGVARVTFNDTSAYHRVFMADGGNGNPWTGVDGAFGFGGTDSSDQFAMLVGEGAGGTNGSLFQSTETMTANTAYSLVSTLDTVAVSTADILKIYKDGTELAGSLTDDDVDPGTLVENQLGVIGGEQLNTSNNTVNANGRLRGSVSDFVILKRFLAASEASRLSKALSVP
tara:strand:+ start:817 stop:1674 length:858 start_codon:yes stop_codon:yes gene_type:complete